MLATGIVRRIDDLGRIVIPKELRRKFGINDGNPVEIFTDDSSIILRRYDAVDDIGDIVNRLQTAIQEAEELDNREKALEFTDKLAALLKGEK